VIVISRTDEKNNSRQSFEIRKIFIIIGFGLSESGIVRKSGTIIHAKRGKIELFIDSMK
jgi:preprotein translocase subunit Sec63